MSISTGDDCIEAACDAARVVHITTVSMTLRFLTGQIRHFSRLGLDIDAVSSPDDDLEAFGRSETTPVHGIAMSRAITPVADVLSLLRLIMLFDRVEPSIVHAHTPKAGLLGMLAAALTRTPARIYHVHGLPLLTASGIRRRLLTLSERVACRLAHQVLCVSRSVRDAMIEEGLCEPDRIKVLLEGSINGVDARGRFQPCEATRSAATAVRERLGIPAGARVLGFIGRIVRDKGIVELAEAWSRLREQYPEAYLLLIGPVEPQDPVPERVLERLRVDPRVRMTGMDWDTPRYYATMDVLVLPTYREGFPVVPLEAAAMEVPVVATRVPGCIDAVLHDCTGTLVEPRNAEALAHAVCRYLDDPALRARHGRAGRERVLRDFQQERMWEALLDEYRRLLGSRWPARHDAPREPTEASV